MKVPTHNSSDLQAWVELDSPRFSSSNQDSKPPKKVSHKCGS